MFYPLKHIRKYSPAIFLCLLLFISSCSDRLSDKISKHFMNANDSSIEAIVGISRRDHYNRNQYQKIVPATELEITSIKDYQNYWIFEGNSATHNLGEVIDNVVYRGVGINLHKQVVYDRYGMLVESDENMGTYDFGVPYNADASFNMKGLQAHIRIDVVPWILWGNTINDKTTQSDRVAAFLKSAKRDDKDVSKMKVRMLNDLTKVKLP